MGERYPHLVHEEVVDGHRCVNRDTAAGEDV